REFTLLLRIPAWSKGASLTINGGAPGLSGVEKGYLRIRRQWQKGDTLVLDLPLEPRRLEANPAVKEDRGRVALARGPLIYCFEGADHDGFSVRSAALPREAKLEAAEMPGLLGGITVIRAAGVVADSPDWGDALYREAPPGRAVTLTAIPYHLWDHRQPGEMLVWIPETAGLAEPAARTADGQVR